MKTSCLSSSSSVCMRLLKKSMFFGWLINFEIKLSHLNDCTAGAETYFPEERHFSADILSYSSSVKLSTVANYCRNVCISFVYLSPKKTISFSDMFQRSNDFVHFRSCIFALCRAIGRSDQYTFPLLWQINGPRKTSDSRRFETPSILWFYNQGQTSKPRLHCTPL